MMVSVLVNFGLLVLESAKLSVSLLVVLSFNAAAPAST
jgi:hypothetical protein